jgi:hypothetical protein
MSTGIQDIYALLPAFIRTRDAQSGEPLKALLGVFTEPSGAPGSQKPPRLGVVPEQVSILQENLAQLYDDQFIETCAAWVIPYIADLIGWKGVFEGPLQVVGGLRAAVANTIGYRRRKGTLVALEQVARDWTGWPALVVEFFKRLATTQSMHHIRPKHLGFVDLRHGAALDRIDTPFDILSRTIDVRRIAPRQRPALAPDATPLDVTLHGGGHFNIPDIGAFLWRWWAYPVTGQPAFAVDARRFLFSPLGNDMPLFNHPAAQAQPFDALVTRAGVPQPIRRWELHDSLADFYGDGQSIQILVGGKPVPPAQICACDLADAGPGQWGRPQTSCVAIDPVLGRIRFPANAAAPASVTVNYCYGFPADIGGGPYKRSVNLGSDAPFDWHRLVGTGAVGDPNVVPTLLDAVASWNKKPGKLGIIMLDGFSSAQIDLTGPNAIQVPAGSTLVIAAGRTDVKQTQPTPDLTTARAVLFGNVEVMGLPAKDAATPVGRLVLSGIVLAGSVLVAGQVPLDVQISDCTLVPGRGLSRDNLPVDPGEPSVVVKPTGATLRLLRTISGPLFVAAGAGVTHVCSSVLDAASPCRPAYVGDDGVSEGPPLHIEDSTVIGKVWTHLMELASNTILLSQRARHDTWQAAVWCARRQAGCVRFCFVPADSIIPRHYQCLPGDPTLEGALEPSFITLRYGLPSYALLSGDCPVAVWRGADDQSQMGVYHDSFEPQAVGNLRTGLAEYLPFGLEAGVFLVPSRPLARRVPRAAYGYGHAATSDPCNGDEAGADDLRWFGIGAGLI